MARRLFDTFFSVVDLLLRSVPPKLSFRSQTGINGNATPITSKPLPPPRDHLKVDKDGRITNRTTTTTPPQLPARITTNNNNNNNNNSITTNATPVTTVAPSVGEPTREQLDSIKKYQVGIFVFSKESDETSRK